MPKYMVEYGLDIPAYGSVEIEADDIPELKAEIKRLYGEDLLIQGWTIRPDCGTDSHRIVTAFVQVEDDPIGEVIEDFQFDLDDTDYFEDGPALWIVYDDDASKVMGHATIYEDAVTIADQLNNVRILKARL